MTLDPSRSYTAAEVQGFLDHQALEEVQRDLRDAATMARQTASQLDGLAKEVTGLTKEVKELKDIVESHVQLRSHPGTSEELEAIEAWRQKATATDQELGLNSMSPDERGALPAVLRTYLAGQQSVKHRERMWQRITGAIFLVSGAMGILYAFGFVTWFRVHVLHVAP